MAGRAQRGAGAYADGTVSAVIRKAYDGTVHDSQSPSGWQNTTISLGVSIDKWLALTNRPAQIVRVTEAEAKRDALRKLVCLLAGADGAHS